MVKSIINNLYNALLDFYYCKRYLGGVIKPYNKGAYAMESSDYAMLPKIFSSININAHDVIVDVGCGSGRVILWLLKKGYKNKIIGIELNPDIAKKTKRLFAKYSNVSIVEGDIIDNIPKYGTIYYLYNPFEPFILRRFKEEISKKFTDKETILYFHCPHVEVFEYDDNWQVNIKEINEPGTGIEYDKLAIIKKIKQVIND